MKKHNMITGLFLTLAIFLIGCASTPDFSAEVDPFTLFDEDASIYAHVKIDGNEKILSDFLVQSIQDIDEESIDILLERSHALYVAIFDGSANDGQTIQLALQGSFPTFIVNSSLNEKKGWTNHTASINAKTYKYKQHETGMQLASVSSNLIIASTKNIALIQDRITKNAFTAINWPMAYGKDGTLANIHTLCINSSAISVYLPKAKTLVPTILQAPIELAIEYAYGEVDSIDDKNLSLTLQLKMQDERVARGTLTLLKIATIGTNLSIESKDETMLILSNIPFSPNILYN